MNPTRIAPPPPLPDEVDYDLDEEAARHWKGQPEARMVRSIEPSSDCGQTLAKAGLDPSDVPAWAYQLEHILERQQKPTLGTSPKRRADRAAVIRRLLNSPRERALLVLQHGPTWWKHVYL